MNYSTNFLLGMILGCTIGVSWYMVHLSQWPLGPFLGLLIAGMFSLIYFITSMEKDGE